MLRKGPTNSAPKKKPRLYISARVARDNKRMRRFHWTMNLQHNNALLALFDQMWRFVVEFGSRILLQLLVLLHGVS